MKKATTLLFLILFLSMISVRISVNARASNYAQKVTNLASTYPIFTSESISDKTAGRLWVVRAYYSDVKMINQLASWIEPWEVNRQEGYATLSVTQEEYYKLLDLGFRVEIDQQLTQRLDQPNLALPGQLSGIPGYPCYRTVEETYASIQQLMVLYPGLVEFIDIGDSWEKITPAGNPGYDLWVMKITNQAIPGPKPKLFAMASIHAREYAAAELLMRTAERLLAQYNINPDLTWLLDYHEIHILIQANPDGRKYAEAGFSWRKNTNSNFCPSIPNYRGVDLNRNFSFQWGCCGGSSSDPCSDVFRGDAPSSESETQAVQTYIRSRFLDQRLDDLDTPAPVDTSGIFIDVHSYGGLILWPWGFTNQPAPNGVALQTLGRKLAYFNNYSPSQAVDLYLTDGTTTDFAYGDLGTAAIAYEVGTDFFQSCDLFENKILPDNYASILYAIKAARTPYITPAGPEVVSVTITPSIFEAGQVIQLSVILDDTRYQQGYGNEPVQNISAASHSTDVPFWKLMPPDYGSLMTPTDGNLDNPTEAFHAALDTTSLTPGRHTIYFRGQDADGNWGAISSAFIYIGKSHYLPMIIKN